MSIDKPPAGTYGAKVPGGKVLKSILEPMARMQIASYRRSGGTNRMSRMVGFPVVLLTTKGAKTGLPRTASIGGFADGGDTWIVVASNMGSASHPAWFINMVANPDDIWLEVGRRKVKVHGESLKGAAREDAIKRIAALSARYGQYPKKTDREIPVVRLTPAA